MPVSLLPPVPAVPTQIHTVHLLRVCGWGYHWSCGNTRSSKVNWGHQPVAWCGGCYYGLMCAFLCVSMTTLLHYVQTIHHPNACSACIVRHIRWTAIEWCCSLVPPVPAPLLPACLPRVPIKEAGLTSASTCHICHQHHIDTAKSCWGGTTRLHPLTVFHAPMHPCHTAPCTYLPHPPRCTSRTLLHVCSCSALPSHKQHSPLQLLLLINLKLLFHVASTQIHRLPPSSHAWWLAQGW